MATKKIRTEKKGKKTAGTVDPFSATVESVATPTTDKPKRAIKVIKAAKLINAASNVSETTRPSSRTAADAFAERAVPESDSVNATLEPLSEIVRAKMTPQPGAAKKLSRAAKTNPTGTTAPTKKAAKASTRKPKRSVVADPPAVVAVAKIESMPDATSAIRTSEPRVALSPVFKALADVQLPELPRENRARLQMQSPTRLYFYWSLRQNPWQQLRAVFGPDLGSYTLVLKLRNLTTETEEIQPVETEGEWWFNAAEPNSEYVAELGFFATNRPYFRVLYSNTISTPRRSPSTHPATEARWTVSATKFAEVLDASGFTRDAVDVAIAGDDHLDAAQRTTLAFSDLMTGAEYSTRGIAAEDMRHAILALAGGATLDRLRHRVSASLFNILQANADRLSTSGARKALTDHFDIEETEWTEEQFGPAVHGASLVNFPKTLKSRTDTKRSPRYNPVSSFSLGR